MRDQKMTTPRLASLVAVAACTIVSACTGQDVRQNLGLSRNQPDAFQVVSRPPLSVPPVYHLRPPSDEPLNSVPAADRAQALILRDEELPATRLPSDDPAYMPETGVVPVESGALGSAGDSALLNRAGAGKAQGDIRSVLNEETRAYTSTKREEKESLMGKINPFERKDGDPTVDAKAEADRIAKAKKDGEALNKGEVKEIDPKKEGLF